MKCPKCLSDNPDTKSFCADCGTQLTPSEATPSAPAASSEGEAPAQSIPTVTLETPIEEIMRGTLFAGRYEIIEELGRGGMGRVYRVEDKKVGQEVALKLIKPEIASDAKTLERFRNELKTARMIAHKNVCRMFDLGEASSTYFITMEYVSGEDLKGLIRQVGRLDTGTAVKMAGQICEGLAEAHRLGVVHRDLKPSNIMIDREGSARIMDFGIARSLKAKGMTGTGIVIGTPEYMSPEQAEAKEVDQRSDIYSLGVILFEMVTGRLPFVGDTPLSIAMKHKGEEPEEPSSLNPQIPEELSLLILRCLAKDKADRFESASEMVAELDSIKSSIPTTERAMAGGKTAGKTAGKRSTTSKEITLSLTPKKFVGTAMAVGVAIVAVVGLLLWRPWSAKAPSAADKIENSIAVISFENQTGDSGYDHLQKVFTNLLITRLEATAQFHVLTWERMRDISRQMGEEGSDVIDQDLGFDICRREGIEALAIGTFTKLGDMFAADVKVYDVDTKRSLSSASSRGEGEQSILTSQIDDLSREIVASRGGARGEKGGATAGASHIAEVTTSSLEAYNLYLRGVELAAMMYMEEARQSLEKAVEIDPTFASAYLELSTVYFQTEDPRGRIEAIKKAMELSDRVTEKERLFIEAVYVSMVELDLERSVELFENLVSKYPREKLALFWLGAMHYYHGAHDESIDALERALELDPRYAKAVNLIAYSYAEKGEYEKAVEYFERYVALSPGQANPHDSLADAYLQMGRLEESLDEYKEALRIKPDFGSQWKLAYTYAIKEEYDEALTWIDESVEVASVAGLKALGRFWKAFYLYWLGDLDRSFAEVREAEALAKEVGNELMLSLIDAFRGWIHSEKGEYELSREGYKKWNVFIRGYMPMFETSYDAMYFSSLGILSLREGRIDGAADFVEEIEPLLEKTDPQNIEWVTYHRDLLRAEVLLARGESEEGDRRAGVLDEALAVAEGIKGLRFSYTLTPASGIIHNMPPCKDVLARIYVARGNVDKAVAEYERLLAFDPEEESRYLIHPLYYYRLGILYEQTGATAKAREQYERFLELWKNADLNREEVKDARSRLASL
jgi:serine/threonine protein kinase/tetratricopeptide (TPR) repeat protein